MKAFPSSVSLFALVVAAGATARAADVTVDLSTPGKPISPYIYGANQPSDGIAYGSLRWGGNRATAYNWETNDSNAGSDYIHSNDTFACSYIGLTPEQCATPAGALHHFVDQANEMGAYPLLTLQMAGYVSADHDGAVAEGEAAPSARFLAVQAAKGGAFADPPDATDSAVYMDELVAHLVTQYGAAGTAGSVLGYSLDNEPDLWSVTHPRIHPNLCGAAELITRSTALATAVKAVAPQAETFGYASFGFSGYMTLTDAPDWETEQGSYPWYVDYYLAKMKAASDSAGKRLLDVLDLHYYSEARGGPGADENTRTRIVEGAEENAQARVHATRSLWDPDYGYSLDPTVGETSWICHWLPDDCPIRLLPRVQEAIDTYNPDTKLAITEYDYGAADHISGGLAQVDALALYGQYGLYFATRWGEGGTFVDAAFRLFLDYDGAGGKYGDTSLATTSSDTVNVPAYASVDSADPSKLHVVLLNRNATDAQTAQVVLNGGSPYLSGKAYGFSATSSGVEELDAIASITGNSFSYVVPAMSVVHLVLSTGQAGADGTAGASGGGGATGDAGDAGGTDGGRGTDAGCGCRAAGTSPLGSSWGLVAGLFGFALVGLRRRRSQG